VALVAEAAVAGRGATLLVEAGRYIIGRLDLPTGRVDLAAQGTPTGGDLLDERVASMGGQVLVISAEEMPTATGVAAIYRY
jgi:hypothetical protein